jgi:hypothetical protein
MTNSASLDSRLIRIIKSLIRYYRFYRLLALGRNSEGTSEDLKDIVKKTFRFADEGDKNKIKIDNIRTKSPSRIRSGYSVDRYGMTFIPKKFTLLFSFLSYSPHLPHGFE